MMISFDAKLAARLIATHCLWPPDMFRILPRRSGILTPVDRSASLACSSIFRSFRKLKGPRLK
jgi:hypothetical protein